MTPKRLTAITARLKAATPGPYRVEFRHGHSRDGFERPIIVPPKGKRIAIISIDGLHKPDECRPNAEFLAHAWQDIKDFLYENARLNRRLKDLEQNPPKKLTLANRVAAKRAQLTAAVTSHQGSCPSAKRP